MPRASADLGRQLVAFRASHPLRTATLGGQSWSYLRSDGDGPVILLLAGALGKAEFGFPVAAALERKGRVIAPDYPSRGGLEALVAGLAALLDAERVDRAHVVGGSFGGIAAQAFAWRHPERVASLVLSHAGAPRRMRAAGLAAALLELIPGRLLLALMRRRLRPVLSGAEPFWADQFDLAVARLTKADVLSRVRVTAEFGALHADRRPERPSHPVLIIDADDDPLFPAADRDALHAFYPHAERVQFTGTGHIAALLEPGRLAAAITDFVLRAEAPGRRGGAIA